MEVTNTVSPIAADETYHFHDFCRAASTEATSIFVVSRLQLRVVKYLKSHRVVHDFPPSFLCTAHCSEYIKVHVSLYRCFRCGLAALIPPTFSPSSFPLFIPGRASLPSSANCTEQDSLSEMVRHADSYAPCFAKKKLIAPAAKD